MVGKPIKEMAALYQQMAAAVRQPQQQAQYQPPPQPATQVAGPPQPPTEQEFLMNPAQATQRYAEYLEATRWRPQQDQQTAQMAQTNRSLVEIQRSEDFKRWGPEIDLKLRELAPNPAQWTSQNINAVVDIVRAQHVNDLVSEEVDRRIKSQLGGATLRPDAQGGAPGVPQAAQLDFEKFPKNYAQALKRLGITAGEVDEFLQKSYVNSGMEQSLDAARERWVKQVMRGDIVTDGREYLSGVYL